MTADSTTQSVPAATSVVQQSRLASGVSDTFGPLPSLGALCAAGAEGSTPFAGVGWGLLAMFFVAILPYSITWKMRHPSGGGRLGSSVRAAYMGLAVGTAAVGLGLLWLLGAPHQLLWVVIAILVTLAVVAVTNAKWGWSNHLAACAAGVSMLVVLLGPGALIAAVVLPAVAWARLAMNRHSVPELVAGAVIGAGVATAVLEALL